ncbi:hypothetical protein GCM10010885_03710 [Alicyclobacillus cellulosilyticus]|uniref:Zinc finger DksA/TraR C4-type domain-containing protein n=1 Tax=Alicyclobacillus cellulosilyticus TaxID=1003997 RepID=A0A917K1G5_9BACL|nr:TraR/DksA C4-type zinc finger protein [Alicyclobacillus cellulosilyticus]GGI97362.1 hypothetical protein GCM10010885_03710 [Alicyclobacillus cellulosilyticus]
MAPWEAQRRRLAAQRDAIRGRLERSGQYGLNDSMQDQLGELSLYDNHPADIGDELFERSKDLALRDRDKLVLQEIERALAAIEDGSYGRCAACGQAIPAERLEAYPAATLCVVCKQAEEAQRPDAQRPVEESFLWPGFGRTDLDRRDAAAFDGEDAWQAVARFNERRFDYESEGLDDEPGYPFS